MTKKLIDAELRAKLNGFKEHVEICSEDGSTLGHFLPDEVYRKLVCSWAKS